MKNKHSNESLDLMSKNRNNWKGVFYLNRKDPRLIVPKLDPTMGWTLNFGSIYTYFTIIGVIAIVILSKTLL